MTPKDQVKQNLNILDVVSTYVRLEKSGRQYKARCPFHNEKSGSFFVSPERGSYHCFGCGQHGDIFSFVEKVESIPFYEALKILADRAGVKLTLLNAEQKDKESRVITLLESAKSHFQNNLKESATAKKYLSDRGLTDEVIQKFEIGYAVGGDTGWRDLFISLSKASYSPEEMVRAGVVLKSESGEKFFDRFRGRIMFPIKNSSGATIGFTGRVLPEYDDGKMGKYVNSPETEVFHKGKILFGYDLARKSIAEQGEVIVVEGQMDLIASHMAGVTNVVASSGTAFTDDQIKILKRFSDKVLLSFDADAAGEAAMQKSAVMSLFGGLDVYVVPKIDGGGKDVADLVQNLGVQAWQIQVSKSMHIVEYVLNNIFEKLNRKEIEEREVSKKVQSEIFPILKAIQSDMDRAYFIKLISNKLKVAEEVLISDLRNFRNQDTFSSSSPSSAFSNFSNNFSNSGNSSNLENSEIKSLAPSKKELILKEILAILNWKNMGEAGFVVSFNSDILKEKVNLEKIFTEDKLEIPDEIVEKEIIRLENIFESNLDYKNKEGEFIKNLLEILFVNYKIEILNQELKKEEYKDDLVFITELHKEIQNLKNKTILR